MREGRKIAEIKSSKTLALILVFSMVLGILPVAQIPDAKAVSLSSETGHGLSDPRNENGTVTWDCVYFGNYPQSDATGEKKEPIKWRVLSVDGDDAFLLADKNLDVQIYNDTKTEVTWETCMMRAWLNSAFLNKAFSASEQAAIKDTTVVNADNPHFGTEGGENTVDKVYLLSIDEVMDPSYGFTSKGDATETRVAQNTTYVTVGGEIKSGLMNSGDKSRNWWLRSPGYGNSKGCRSDFASRVEYVGSVAMDGVSVNQNYTAVRPALHLNLKKSSDAAALSWSYAGTVTSQGGEIGIATPVPTSPAPAITSTPLMTSVPSPTQVPSVTESSNPSVPGTPTPAVTSAPAKTLEPSVTGTSTPAVTSAPAKTSEPLVPGTSTPAVTSAPAKTLEPLVPATPTPAVTSTPVTTLIPLVPGTSNPVVTVAPVTTLAPSVTESSSVGMNLMQVYSSAPAQDISNETQEKEDAVPGTVMALKLKAKTKAFQASWKKVSGAAGYQIWISTSKKFRKKSVKTTKKEKLTIKKLKSGKTYFVKVCAYTVTSGKKVYRAWSKMVKKKVK